MQMQEAFVFIKYCSVSMRISIFGEIGNLKSKNWNDLRKRSHYENRISHYMV